MEFTVQKLHPALCGGQRLIIRNSNAPAFSYQGAWDSACSLYCLGMAGTILGRLTDPAKVSSRRRGPEAVFWEKARPFYLSGTSLTELVDLIHDLDWKLATVVLEGAHSRIMEFCEKELSRGHLVIVNWRPVREPLFHSVLAVGLEGLMRGRKFDAHTLLVLDPGEAEPWLATCNARMSLGRGASGNRSRDALYVTASYTGPVIADGAVSIRVTGTKRTVRAEPP